MIPPRSDQENQGSDMARLGASLAAKPYARRGVTASERTIRVMLVDDHAMVREGLSVLLRAAPDIAVVGEADNGKTAVAAARALAPDIMVLDLDMPLGDGTTALHELGRELPDVKVLILTVHSEQERLLPLLEAGARGYLTKEAASRELVDAIRVVASGEIYVRPTVARLLASAVVSHHTAQTARERYNTLSEREQTILRMAAQGFSGAEIARQLGISTKTVDTYKHRIQDKLGLTHRTDYVRFAIEAALLNG